MATQLRDEPQAGYSIDRMDGRQERLYEAARPIINRLSNLAAEQVRAKKPVEQRWLEDTLDFHGQYDTDTIKDLKAERRSRAFINLPRHKTNSWAARLMEMLFASDIDPWGIQPTPIPELAQQAQQAMKQAQAAVETANVAEDPEQQERVKEIADTFAQAARQARAGIEEAQKRCSAMEKSIKDQLVECDWIAQCRDVIDDGCKLGTGILKGPITSQRLRQQWQEQDGRWQLVAVPDPIPEFRRVDPWHFFPDMSAARIGEAEFTFERHLPNAKDLKRLARKLNFDKVAIRRLLEEGPQPLGLDVDHLVQLRSITGEGDPLTSRYVMWEYHGALECSEIAMLLRAMGQVEKAERFEREKDPLDDYRVIMHFCNNEVLKIAPEYPLDSGESLYSIWNFEKGETSVFGIGVPNIMHDSVHILNAAVRMMVDNAALAAAPQIVINRTVITPASGDGDYGIRPRKAWLLSSTAGVIPQVPPFQTFDIPMNTQPLQLLVELTKTFIDEETGMPQIAQGEQGNASQTLGGMSMLFNSANVVFRRLVKGWDDEITKPTIRRAYDWNMQFNPDENVKGDMQVDARGTAILLVREFQSPMLQNILTNWTVHPEIGPWFKAKKGGLREALEKTFQTLQLTPDDFIASEDEFDEYVRKQAEQAQDEPADPNAIRLQIAQMEMQTRTQIAQMQTDLEVAKLSATTGMTEQEIRAKYGIEELKIGSQERMKAVDIAIEDKRAREAEAAGESESEAVGQGVG